MDRHENLDELLIEMSKFDDYSHCKSFNSKSSSDVSKIWRKMAQTTKSTLQLVNKDDGSYSLNSTILFVTVPNVFRLGKEKDVKTQDGRQIKNTFTIEGNVLTEHQIGDKHFVVVREFFDDELIMTSTVGSVSSKTWCKRVN